MQHYKQQQRYTQAGYTQAEYARNPDWPTRPDMPVESPQSPHEGLIPPNTLRYSELHGLMLIEKF